MNTKNKKELVLTSTSDNDGNDVTDDELKETVPLKSDRDTTEMTSTGESTKKTTNKQLPQLSLPRGLTSVFGGSPRHQSSSQYIQIEDKEEEYEDDQPENTRGRSLNHQSNMNRLNKSKTEHGRSKRIEGILSINSLIKNQREYEEFKNKLQQKSYDDNQLKSDLLDGLLNDNSSLVQLLPKRFKTSREQRKLFYSILLCSYFKKEDLNNDQFREYLRMTLCDLYPKTPKTDITKCIEIANSHNLNGKEFQKMDEKEFAKIFESINDINPEQWTKIYVSINKWEPKLDYDMMYDILMNNGFDIDEQQYNLLKSALKDQLYGKSSLIDDILDAVTDPNNDDLALSRILEGVFHFNSEQKKLSFYNIILHKFINVEELNIDNFSKILKLITIDIEIEKLYEIGRKKKLNGAMFLKLSSDEFAKCFESIKECDEKKWRAIYGKIEKWELIDSVNYNKMYTRLENSDFKIDEQEFEKLVSELNLASYTQHQLMDELCDGYSLINEDQLILSRILSQKYDSIKRNKFYHVLLTGYPLTKNTKNELLDNKNFIKILQTTLSNEYPYIDISECGRVAVKKKLDGHIFKKGNKAFVDSKTFAKLFANVNGYETRAMTTIYRRINTWKLPENKNPWRQKKEDDDENADYEIKHIRKYDELPRYIHKHIFGTGDEIIEMLIDSAVEKLSANSQLWQNRDFIEKIYGDKKYSQLDFEAVKEVYETMGDQFFTDFIRTHYEKQMSIWKISQENNSVLTSTKGILDALKDLKRDKNIIFEDLDINHDGRIEILELQYMLSSNGKKVQEEKLWDNFRQEHGDAIQQNEFEQKIDNAIDEQKDEEYMYCSWNNQHKYYEFNVRKKPSTVHEFKLPSINNELFNWAWFDTEFLTLTAEQKPHENIKNKISGYWKLIDDEKSDDHLLTE